MRLATWNLERPDTPAHRRALREQVDEIAADVWVFTETRDEFTQGFPFSCLSSAGRDRVVGLDAPADRWIGISSRHRLEPLPTSDPERTAAARVFRDEGPPFLVYGLVLPWGGDKWHGHPSVGGIAFREALKVQLADWRQLRREYPDDELFVLGDFNQDLAPSHYYGSGSNRAALIAALDECGLVALTAGDGDPIWRDSAPWACIDHVCSLRDSNWLPQPAIRWPDAPKPAEELSDHFGVAVSFLPHHSR